jgi:hypothetical protein
VGTVGGGGGTNRDDETCSLEPLCAVCSFESECAFFVFLAESVSLSERAFFESVVLVFSGLASFFSAVSFFVVADLVSTLGFADLDSAPGFTDLLSALGFADLLSAFGFTDFVSAVGFAELVSVIVLAGAVGVAITGLFALGTTVCFGTVTAVLFTEAELAAGALAFAAADAVLLFAGVVEASDGAFCFPAKSSAPTASHCGTSTYVQVAIIHKIELICFNAGLRIAELERSSH